MDLIRSILLLVEAQEGMDGFAEFMLPVGGGELEGYSQGQLDYHVRLLREAGFLAGNVGNPLIISRLTWPGHEFLDNVKDAVFGQKLRNAWQAFRESG